MNELLARVRNERERRQRIESATERERLQAAERAIERAQDALLAGDSATALAELAAYARATPA